MKYCSLCKKKIAEENLDKIYQISLGNIIKNQFYESITYYYHLDCLSVSSANLTEPCLNLSP